MKEWDKDAFDKWLTTEPEWVRGPCCPVCWVIGNDIPVGDDGMCQLGHGPFSFEELDAE
jgi:hypothetical protein